MYLKASSKQERQQWLVALGSSKACMTTRSRKDMDQGSGDSLKSKKFELKLYCDLLMQQVHQVKTCVNEHNRIDTSKLDEATSLLTVTCDTFITTLDECMKLADANFLFMLSHHPTDNPIPLGCHQKGKPGVMPVMKRSSSYESSEVKSLEKKTWNRLKVVAESKWWSYNWYPSWHQVNGILIFYVPSFTDHFNWNYHTAVWYNVLNINREIKWEKKPGSMDMVAL